MIGLSLLATSCGSGGGLAAQEMILVELQFLDRGLVPTQPTGTQNLPRNAIVGMIFSERVDPLTVTNQTVQVRYGGSFQSVPPGSFNVNGNQVLFDPTVTNQGQPNPLGFQPVTQYILDIPGTGEQETVVQNSDGDPNLTTFFTQFTTADGWLRELDPPKVKEIIWVPKEDQLTQNIPGNGIMGVVFNEPMNPATFEQGLDFFKAGPTTTIDVRYTDDAVNVTNGFASIDPETNKMSGRPIPGTYQPSADYQTYFFTPMFSFGAVKLIFTVEVFQGLKDLSGNLLVNPGSYGPFTCDGTGIEQGWVIYEDFSSQIDMDWLESTADWGDTVEGLLQGQPVTSSEIYIFGYIETLPSEQRGQYASLVHPMTSTDILNYIPNMVPAPAQGIRCMYSFSDTQIGDQAGSITAIAWGPEANATYAAFYKDIRLRMGYQKSASMTLSPSFSGNYEGQPTMIYKGDYSVAQKANWGNTPGHPTAGYSGAGATCNAAQSSNVPFQYSGFYPYPKLTTYFEWDPGVQGEEDSVLLFDASIPAGDTFQTVRTWFGVTTVCAGVLIGGLPLTRMYSTYEDDEPNPASSFAAGIQNPEQSFSDTRFTLTRRVSIGQSWWYQSPFGTDSEWRRPLLEPAAQAGGAQVIVEFQGADQVDINGNPVGDVGNDDNEIDYVDWTQNIDDCFGREYLRYRIQLISNIDSLAVAKISTIIIPLVDANP